MKLRLDKYLADMGLGELVYDVKRKKSSNI